MCGIVGIVARGTCVPPGVLERATLSLAHRGPDDSGTIILRLTSPEPIEIGLGNRRLAILDVSPLGHQPMQDAVTGNWIVFNGEIYNYRDIRQELQREGVAFVSNSDTEVLLKAYGRWGEESLDRLRGMFAFAIWDNQRQSLLLARDPMAIKPLYYHAGAKHFLFASEVRTLIGTGLIPLKLNPAGVHNFLSFGSVYDPNTLIDGISALRPGHFLICDGRHCEERRYYDWGAPDVRTSPPAPRVSQAAVVSDTRRLLLDSVRLHTVSDVPIGVFLSGGIDSSSLVSLLTEVGVRVNTFSLVFRESGYSEAGYSREVARHFGTEHHELCIDQRDAIDRLPSAIGAMDQPTIDGINTFLISRAVHDTGLKVALSGLGADELFGGYSSFKTVPRMERVASAYSYLPEAVRTRIARYVLARGGDRGRKLSALVRNPQQIVHPYFISRMLFTPEQVCRLAKFNGQFTAAAVSPLHEMCERARELDPMTRVSYLESRAYMANTLLRDSDGMSMAHSLELRVPFVDHHLASYVQSIPGKWKFTNGTPKPLLLAALGRKLPDRVVYRRKQGFTLPFALWLKQDLREAAERTLTARPDSCVASLLDYSAVQGVWKDFLAGGTSWSRPWSLYILSKWCELHMG